MTKFQTGIFACLLALAIVVTFLGHPTGDLGSAAVTLSALVMSAFGGFLAYQALGSRHHHRH
jgi:hypothetical protein